MPTFIPQEQLFLVSPIMHKQLVIQASSLKRLLCAITALIEVVTASSAQL